MVSSLDLHDVTGVTINVREFKDGVNPEFTVVRVEVETPHGEMFVNLFLKAEAAPKIVASFRMED